MLIKQIISEADVLTAEQLAKVTGGITPSNTNTVGGCKCIVIINTTPQCGGSGNFPKEPVNNNESCNAAG